MFSLHLMTMWKFASVSSSIYSYTSQICEEKISKNENVFNFTSNYRFIEEQLKKSEVGWALFETIKNFEKCANCFSIIVLTEQLLFSYDKLCIIYLFPMLKRRTKRIEINILTLHFTKVPPTISIFLYAFYNTCYCLKSFLFTT